MKQRLETLDICKGIAMILVTIGHILGSIPTPSRGIVAVMHICYAVELPIFFMACGIQLQYNDTTEKTAKSFFCSRLKRIMWPYLTFSIFYLLIDASIVVIKYAVKKVISWDALVAGIFESVFLWGRGALWFLPVFFEVSVLFYLINKYFYSLNHLLSISIMLIGNLFAGKMEAYYPLFLESCATIKQYVAVSIIRTMVAYSYVYIGALLMPLIKRAATEKRSLRKSATGLFFVILGCIGAQLTPEILDLHFGYTRNPFVTYPTAIILFIGLFMLVDGYKVECLVKISNNSMFLMGMQFLTGYIVKVTLIVWGYFNIVMNSYCVGIVASILFIATIIPCTYIQKKYVPFMIKPPIKQKGEL